LHTFGRSGCLRLLTSTTSKFQVPSVNRSDAGFAKQAAGKDAANFAVTNDAEGGGVLHVVLSGLKGLSKNQKPKSLPVLYEQVDGQCPSGAN
jgi:hypothetical protein